MEKLDFKLQFYFNLYKDKPFNSRDEFRLNFRKKHGRFQFIEELILMIEKYQMKKYGGTISNHFSLRTNKEAIKISNRSRAREIGRLKYERKN